MRQKSRVSLVHKISCLQRFGNIVVPKQEGTSAFFNIHSVTAPCQLHHPLHPPFFFHACVLVCPAALNFEILGGVFV